MHTFKHLKYIQKSRLLHRLVPSEIPAFLAYLNEYTETILNQEASDADLAGGQPSGEMWFEMAEKVQFKMALHANQLHTDADIFASQLFDDDTVIFCAHTIVRYIALQLYQDPWFGYVAKYLFT